MHIVVEAVVLMMAVVVKLNDVPYVLTFLSVNFPPFPLLNICWVSEPLDVQEAWKFLKGLNDVCKIYWMINYVSKFDQKKSSNRSKRQFY